MKKLIAFLLMVIFTSVVEAAPLNQYLGNWTNINPNTRGITKIKIFKQAGRLKMQVYGKCHPSDCNWGVKRAFAYSSSVASNVNYNTRAIVATFNKSFAQTIVTARKSGSRLHVTIYNRFRDGSGRTNYIKNFILKKSNNTGSNFGNMSLVLMTPRQLSPLNNTTFHHYPRRTTLRWTRVRGAVRYGLEIDCFHCCQSGRWCYNVNHRPWRSAITTANHYRFNFVGAQPGRWRVWAIDAKGRKSAKSPWRYFRYTR